MSKQNDIIIPLGPSKIGHLDLKFALRSIEKNVKNYRDIWIIGDLPKWITGVKHLGFSDDPDPKWKEFNIYNKIRAACIKNEISEDMLMVNDDHFLLEEIDAISYPFYYKGTVTDSWIKNRSDYRKTMNHTRRYLMDRGFDDKNFDTHTPIIYNKKKYLTSFNAVNWGTPWGYGIKTLYCSVNRIKGEYMPDLKLKKKHTYEEVKKMVEGRHVVSCTDVPMKYGLADYLEELFPDKSKYER